MTSSLLLGLCSVCGAPIFRHRRPDGRQITCVALRRLDEQFHAGAQASDEPRRQFEIVRGGRDRGRIDTNTLHGGEV